MIQKIRTWLAARQNIRFTLLGVGVGLVLIATPAVLYMVKNTQPRVPAPTPEEVEQDNWVPTDQRDEISQGAPWLSVTGKHVNIGNDGVIMLSSIDEPTLEIRSYNLHSADITFYQAEEADLLTYLVHDAENSQLNALPDTAALTQIATTTVELKNDSRDLELPLEPTGIYYALVHGTSTSYRGEESSYTKGLFIVRSNFGVLAKEAKDQLVFWGQSFEDLHSIQDGELELYKLEDAVTSLGTYSFSQDGIIETPIDSSADIAVARRDGVVSVIPLNLDYLNSRWGSSYRRFAEQQARQQFFLFTDRPLYHPGDTVYYKAVLRDDDDARYSIPSGRVVAVLRSGYGDNSEIDRREMIISSQGTIDGSFELPANGVTGYHHISIEPVDEVDGQPDRPVAYGASVSFEVEYYTKPEFGIDIDVTTSSVIAGDHVEATISGAYFSGQPLNGEAVEYKIYSGNYYDYTYFTPNLRTLSDDYRYGYWRNAIISSGTVVLDEFGNGIISIDTASSTDQLRDRVYSIEASYTGTTGRPSFARKNILVHRGEVGIYREYARNGYPYGVAPGDVYELPIVAISRTGYTTEGVEATVSIAREEWIRETNANGSYRFRKEEEVLDPVTVTLDADGKGIARFLAEKPGRYTMTVSITDSRGNIVSKEFYGRASDATTPYYSSNEQGTLTSSLDADIYTAGDTAQLQISSTVEDRDVFVALERDYMHRHQVVRLDGASATVSLPVDQSDRPNIFAKVSGFGKGGYESETENIVVSTEDQKLTVEFETDKDSYGPGETVELLVKTTNNEGYPVSAETTVWAVDKALYELVNEAPHQVYEQFWRERYNGTSETNSLRGINVWSGAEGGGCFVGGTQILLADGTTASIEDIRAGDTILTKEGTRGDALVPARVLSTVAHEVPGYLIVNGSLRVTPEHIMFINGTWQTAGSLQVGDLLVNADSQSVLVESIEWQLGTTTVYNLEVEKYHTFIADGIWVHNDKGGSGARSVFKDTAYWNPTVRTNSAGEARIRFTLPDNLTTWVLTSIASTPDTAVGKGREEIIVSKDVIVRPILPNVLREGDELVLSALVQNYTDADHAFDTALDFDAGTAELTRRGTRYIATNRTESEYWYLRPQSASPEATLRYSVSARDDDTAEDTVEVTIPVKPLGFADQRVETAINATTQTISLYNTKPSEDTTISVSLAASVANTVPAAARYLIGYPYGCVEQTTSRFVPAVIGLSSPQLFEEALADKDVDDMVRVGVTRLTRMQNDDGGWGWWYGSSDMFLTVYVSEYMLLARDLGFEINSQVLERAQNFLEREHVRLSDDTSKQDRIALQYGLALFGSNLASTVDSFDSLQPDLLALAVLTNTMLGTTDPDENGLTKLISMKQQRGGQYFWERGETARFGSIHASTGLALRALIAANADRDIIDKTVQYLGQHRAGGYWSNTFGTVQVMRGLADYHAVAAETDTRYSYTVRLDDTVLAQGNVYDARQTIPMISIAPERIAPGGSTLTITKDGSGQLYSTTVVDEFRRDIRNAWVSNGLNISRTYRNKTNPGKPFHVGDIVTVELKVDGFDDEGEFGLITDELPAGLSPINTSFRNEQYYQGNRWWYGMEITENGVQLPLRWYTRKNKTYTYDARVIAEGAFQAPPATVELMYDPSVFGRSSFDEFRTGQFQ